MNDDFSNAPVSLAERKAEKEHASDLWSPRDALIKLLREIDSGETKPENIIIVYTEDFNKTVRTSSFQAGPAEIFYRIGMLQETIIRLLIPKI